MENYRIFFSTFLHSSLNYSAYPLLYYMYSSGLGVYKCLIEVLKKLPIEVKNSIKNEEFA